jgi:nitrate/TMAO reductase-like tetraheme cytochrome c subunit
MDFIASFINHGNKHLMSLAIALIVIPVFLCIPIALHAEKSSCVTCHTSTKNLKEITDTTKRLKQASPLQTIETEGKESDKVRGELAPYEKAEISREFLNKNIHGTIDCTVCHGGNANGADMESSHKGVTKKLNLSSPSSCDKCHSDIAKLDGINFHISPALLARHEWLPLREKHLESLNCTTCHNPSLQSPTKDCSTCH